MHRRRLISPIRSVACWLTLLCLGVVQRAHAQSNPQQLADANRAAMDAYNNLDIETSKKKLEEAATNAEKHGVKGPPLARTYANLGVIYVGGLSDNASGLDAFVKALREDPNVEPDPLVSTPEIQQVFALAKRRAGTGAGSSTVAVSPPAPVEGNIEHIPVVEQLSQTAIPVFARVGDLSVASAKVFYRSLGMPKPKSVDMKRMGDGWGVLIPCTDVFEPNVEYFIVALDDEGAQVGNAGTPQNPVSVPIVTTRSQPAPSLPGEGPPSQCSGDSECPPGVPCAGEGGLGETCRADSDCSEGLMCADSYCATRADERGADDERAVPRFFVDVSFGLGLAYVGKDMKADSAPSRKIAEEICVEASRTPSGAPGTCAQSDVVDIEYAEKLSEDRGWACTVTPGENGGITLSDCTVAIRTPGFVPVPVLNFAAGYYVTPRFAVGLMGRMQLSSGDGVLPGLFFGVRGEYLVTKPTDTGLHVGLLGGAGGGSIQAQPPARTSGAKGPFVTSGPVGVQLGLRAGYRFTRNFGLILTPAANLMVPDFLFDLDINGGVELAF